MKEINKYGIYFWIGGGVYSLINMNLQKINKSKVLTYNYLVTGVAVVGLIMTLIMLKKAKQREE